MNYETRVQMKEILSISDHEAGVNQIIHFDHNELATCSHDLTIKFWDKKTLEKTNTLSSETSNCMCMTGFRGKYLVTGYPNGDIVLFS